MVYTLPDPRSLLHDWTERKKLKKSVADMMPQVIIDWIQIYETNKIKKQDRY